MESNRKSLFIVLSVAFIDLMGVGIVYPIIAAMLFDPAFNLVPAQTSHETRGIWLGILLSLAPLFQFFSAPLWGAFSDNKGRKKPLQYSIGLGVIGYLIAIFSVVHSHLLLFVLSRIIIGFAGGNLSIVSATIADISSKDEKAKNFGLFSMALGAGFTFGPFLGGILSTWGYYVPFLFSLLIFILNLSFAFLFFKETHTQSSAQKLNLTIAISRLKHAFRVPEIRPIFFTFFLHCFAWSFFFEFSPVYLIRHFQFSAREIGIYYGVLGVTYALSTGFLIRPLVRRFKPETLFCSGNCLTAIVIVSLLLLPSPYWLWPILFLISYCVAPVYPMASTMVSNKSDSKIQGEMLGSLGSINAAAQVLSALFSGSFVGALPNVSIFVSGSILLIAGVTALIAFRKEIFNVR